MNALYLHQYLSKSKEHIVLNGNTKYIIDYVLLCTVCNSRAVTAIISKTSTGSSI